MILPLAVHPLDGWAGAALPADVRDGWAALLAVSDGPCPVLQTPGWLAAAADHDGADIRLLVVRDATGAVVGLQPVRYGRVRVTFKSQRRPLFTVATPGATLVGSEPLVAVPTDKPAVLHAVLDHLRDAPVIEFNELSDTGSVAAAVARFAGTGHQVYRIGERGRWSYTTVPRSAADYDALLGKKKRYNLKRQDRLLADHLGGGLDLVVARSAGELDVLDAAARRLTGWSDARLDWAEASARSLAHAGLLHSFVLHRAGRPVGLIRASAWGDQLHVHSIHHDATLDDLSPGTAVWQAALRFLIAGQTVRRITFAYGAPAQAQRAVNISEGRAQVLVFRRSVRAAGVVALHRAFVAGKALMKRSRAARPSPTAADVELLPDAPARAAVSAVEPA